MFLSLSRLSYPPVSTAGLVAACFRRPLVSVRYLGHPCLLLSLSCLPCLFPCLPPLRPDCLCRLSRPARPVSVFLQSVSACSRDTAIERTTSCDMLSSALLSIPSSFRQTIKHTTTASRQTTDRHQGTPVLISLQIPPWNAYILRHIIECCVTTASRHGRHLWC